LRSNHLELSVDITVSDINADMLDVGKKRAVERGSFHGKHYIVYSSSIARFKF
jgi:ubiquinone/menaquinone biosynthesis C-methylase UbiE